ncbi:hypothetical protein GCM10010343_12230 [Streptomyces avidinii]|uniref:Uncharacterized protein n=1 Tax=Streptomyces avidinii TaxID=1895 RepID=A0ABS4KXI8_STRAV|nr:hypothetical protein [Streptomyces avidinii]GGY88632.1 hypothetical protein GCM10010343_12230 [Streptomyces avidinii]
MRWGVWGGGSSHTGFEQGTAVRDELEVSGTLSSGWRLGALRLPGPLHPPVPARCPLPAGSDRERSLRLLQAIDEAVANNAGMAGEWPGGPVYERPAASMDCPQPDPGRVTRSRSTEPSARTVKRPPSEPCPAA